MARNEFDVVIIGSGFERGFSKYGARPKGFEPLTF